MHATGGRPRNLRWFHAGPMLFGDWGTSRLYVLGLAFYYTGHASVMYLAVMSVVMAAVAWAYTVVCRCFPDGGGVYAASRQINPTLSVIGATLLLCDYIVTAALSGVEAFHYFGVPGHLVVPLCLTAIVLIGVVNWLGARSAGRLALFIAVAALGASALIAIFCLPLLPKGLSRVTPTVDGVSAPWERWESLVRIVLALSGVEAVANMTGLMKQPVRRTSRRTIWPVLAEVVILNMIFGIALNALPGLESQGTPDYVTHEVRAGLSSDAVPGEVKEYRDTAMRVLASHTVGSAWGAAAGTVAAVAAGIVFGLLLLSAVNTATMAMVSVMYSMGQDKEVPRAFTRLNYSGVPWIGLLLACALPMGVLLIEADVKALGELYAIGVVGAIAINLLSCAANRKLPVSKAERIGLWSIGGLMGVIELTIIVAKVNATIFAGTLIAVVLTTRFALHAVQRRRPAPPLPEPETGWLAEVNRTPSGLAPGRPRIMLAARGRDQAEFAVDLARRRRGALFAMFVRTLRVMDVAPGAVPRIEEDRDAQEALGTAAVLAHRAGVPFVPIYVVSTDVTSEILDYTVTFGCDTLIMGKSERGLFSRKVSGDVVSQVAGHLPAGISLVTRAPGPFGEAEVVEADDNSVPPPS